MAAAGFLLFWAPVYWHYWGLDNFLFLCDLALMFGCLGLVLQSPLLISSQTLSILLISVFWIVDAGWHVVSGHNLFGATDYMFDSQYPLWLRLISLFHLVLPLVLLWALDRTGYDRRAFRFQALVALAAILASRTAKASLNINFAYTNPFSHRQIGTAPVHLTVTFLAVAFGLYLPAHIGLRKLFAPSVRTNS
ncbi:MAG TPA: hypothetical protein VMJ93_06980 [Verrucomicrobiae bacterium]|nr:hypothetical protein [Verrucomicrobiae bacterium]